MPIHICPRCNQRYVVVPGTTDYVHECKSNVAAIDNEDVVVVGNWQDYTGTGSVSKYNLRFAGTINKLQGTRADIEGIDLEEWTSRGKRASTHRSRQHLEFIELK
jgi:hypothetical protein